MDKALLEYWMDRRGKTIADMCSMLGISRSAFYRKCNGISEFTLIEIQRIIDYLNLAFSDVMEIFFTNKVS